MMNAPPAWALRTKADDEAVRLGCYWSADHAQAIVTFAETFLRPQYIRGPFKLLEWQRRFLMSIYGFRMPDGRRRFRLVSLHVPKKQGKTLLISIIALF